MNIQAPHPYIVATEKGAIVLLLDAQASIAYLARRTLLPEPELVALNRRTFGDASYWQAWPAFDHDTLVALTSASVSPAVRGLAASLLLQRDVPMARVAAPLAPLLQASWSPTGRIVDAAASTPNIQSIAPKTKEAAKIRKSALATLMGSAS